MTASSLSDASMSTAEQSAAQAFARVFDLPSVGIDDDFFELGGDSLIGENLMAELEVRFGVLLSLSVLLSAPTPRLLATEILNRHVVGDKSEADAGQLPRHLIVVHGGGSQPALFLVHGNTGESTAPRDLADAFRGRPYYAFRAPGLEDGEECPNTVGAFAADYLSILGRINRGGQTVLLGHCAGATIAYEMAQELAATGRMPVGLVLIDPEINRDLAPYLFKSGLNLATAQTRWNQRRILLQEAKATEPPTTLKRRREFVQASIQVAVGTYTPKPYPGPTLLIYTGQSGDALLNRERGYPALARNLETVPLSVGHDEMFTAAGTEIGAAINRFVDRLTRS